MSSRDQPRTAVDRTPARRLRDALEPLAMVHVHSAEAHEQYEAIGIEHWSAYVVGRAGTLGLPPTPLVVATFGAFSPDVLLLAISATIGMVLCSVGMLVAKTNHPAACATVLIIALGIMADPIDGAVIVISVVILYIHQEKIVYPLAVKFGFEPEDPRPNADNG